MWHKKQRDQDPAAPPGKRLRDNLVDLYASGEIAGDRAQSLMDDAGDYARAMGSDEFQDLRGAKGPGSAKNKDRDLRRRLLKRSHWPRIYLAELRCYSVRQKRLIPQRVAFLLPHEIIGLLADIGDHNVMCQHGALDAWNEKKHGEIMAALQTPFLYPSPCGEMGSPLVGIGSTRWTCGVFPSQA